MKDYPERDRRIRIPSLTAGEALHLRQLYSKMPNCARSRGLNWYEEIERIQLIAKLRGRHAREIVEAFANVSIGDWNGLALAAAPLLKRGCRR